MTENKEGLKEDLRGEIEAKIERFLQPETRFSGGNRYCGLDLSPQALGEWHDRPKISEGIEPFTPRGDIRIILSDQTAKEAKPAFKSIQLHIIPAGEAPRVKYAYILNLTEREQAKLSYYMDRPVGFSVGDEPAPMMPFGMVSEEATPETLRAFDHFLDVAKPLNSSSDR